MIKCVMFISIILMMVAKLNAQKIILNKQITLHEKNARLREVMRSVRKQTGYSFFITADYEKFTRPVTINVENEAFDQTLKRIFSDQPFIYKVNDTEQVIQITPNAILTKKIYLYGSVYDSTGNPVIGASVRIKGEVDKATCVRANGEFFIVNAPKQGILLISCVGYQTLEVEFNSETNLKFVLKQVSTPIDEKVIKGPYQINGVLNTGSVSTVKAKEFENQSVSNPLLALEGQVPGLFIAQSSGLSGALPSVLLRGQKIVLLVVMIHFMS